MCEGSTQAWPHGQAVTQHRHCLSVLCNYVTHTHRANCKLMDVQVMPTESNAQCGACAPVWSTHVCASLKRRRGFTQHQLSQYQTACCLPLPPPPHFREYGFVSSTRSSLGDLVITSPPVLWALPEAVTGTNEHVILHRGQEQTCAK